VGGRAERRSVQLGARGDSHLEIRDGLAEGDVVLLAGSPAIAAGSRVRPQVAP
jgi:multidrug efflux pump subunit AcrA (membrane-fusion protein)